MPLGFIDYRFFQWIRDDGSGNPILYDKSNTQLLTSSKTTTVVTLEAGSTSGDSFKFKTPDAYPYIQMEGTESIVAYVPTGKHFKINDQTLGQLLHIHHDTTYPIWGGEAVANKHLRFEANTIDHAPYIYFSGNGWITLSCKDVANGIIDYYKDTQHVGRFSEGTTEFLVSAMGTNFDLTLVPNGTGLVRFGVEVTDAGADRGELVKFKTIAGDSVYIKTYDLAP